MQYNSKASLSLVEKAKADGKEIHKAIIHVYDVERKACKTGDYIVSLVNQDDGQKYSAFESVWTAQNINVEQLNEGDELDVTYTLNGDYRNFLKVEIPSDDNPLGFVA